MQELFEKHKQRLGYRSMEDQLRLKNIGINHKTVLKLMKELNLVCKVRRKKYKSFKGEVGKIAPNILQRQFNAVKPFEKLVTDVTEFKLNDTKIYLSPIMDLYNREILSYSISLSPNMQQVKDMLKGIFEILPPNTTPLLHSDQGWQYQQHDYQKSLQDNKIIQSMSRRGNCLDNSCMENFFGQLKSEMFYGETYESIDAFIKELEAYIYYHNNQRTSRKLKELTPVAYKNQSFHTL
jgi:transposase InsO family protein